MHIVTLAAEDDFEGWRAAARALALAQVPPEEIGWQIGEAASFGEADTPAGTGFSVPRRFVDIARTAICHSDPERFALLYALLLRLRGQPRLIDDHADPLVQQLERMARDVRRDMHGMRTRLRFREAEQPEHRHIARFEPNHHILRANADFFVRHFGAMRWSILTRRLCTHWDGKALSFSPGTAGNGSDLPDTALIPGLAADAQAGETSMVEASRAEIGGNIEMAWEALREEAAACTRCPLYKNATQTVFGEGRVDATLMFVGEQPGDQEDLAGRPFVGPAGQLLDRALGEAGIDRTRTYVTNAVKHFKFELRGRRRLHAKPNGVEIEACRWWYEQERMLIRPPVTMALGATAARAMLGKVVTISASRGRPHRLEDGGEGWVTVHPSYLLRITDRAEADREYARFVQDLKRVGDRIAALP
ncbi:uracil-DNA glycosylase [Sphingomonas oleivorans]|uniref:Type-4 uracil-DNA glycosylase n=1 Tax=Sphingomonas oleivorans TaxID=1735121 RepID=A0A2T5FXS5_9SPHN|nr:UdgX family uracil-DNA binding protein [Sphingomonas oleivorans]PTQ10922.1 uracil-DNA glycosylase [Sphingomonas oleivorans]